MQKSKHYNKRLKRKALARYRYSTRLFVINSQFVKKADLATWDPPNFLQNVLELELEVKVGSWKHLIDMHRILF